MNRSFARAVPLRLRTLAILLLLTLVTFPARAQKDSPDIPLVTRAWAIQGATVVQAPGRVLTDATVVIRDGVIEAVGRGIAVPYDARIIDADTLTVYAGLMDALSYAAVPSPQQGQGGQNEVPDRSNPTYERAGIQPERDVRDFLDPEDDSVDEFRRLGYTAVHAVPRGRMLPGQGALVLLTGSDAAGMSYRGDTGVFFQFAGAQGVYPGTPMAIMSKFRQIYREAERRQRLDAMYGENPTGMTRPPYDAVHSSFYPLLEGEKPVIAFTEDVLEVHRALKLQDELGFDLVLAGLGGSFDAVDKVASAGTPVILTLDIPEEAEWMEDIKADSLQYILDSFDDETREATYRDLEAELRNLEARQLMSRTQYLELPKMYAEAGVPFAFTSLGVDTDDIRKALRTYVENGLSEEDALAALTTNAAAILGVSASMGSVEEGKMANLVVTSGNLFEEDTHILHVFVDGDHYEYEPTKK